MGRGTPEGSIARFDLGQGSQALGVASVGNVVGDARVGIFYNGGAPAFSILVDGDPTPVVLSGGPSAGEVWRDVELVLMLMGGTAVNADGLGGSATAMSSGLGIACKGTSIGPLTPKNNSDFLAAFGHVETIPSTGALIPATVIFSIPIASVLDGDAGDTVALTISEDATTLTTLSAAIPVLRYRVL